MDQPSALVGEVTAAVAAVPEVDGVTLCGSRRAGTAGRFSDWDFIVRTKNLTAVSARLPHALDALEPLVGQWDRLSRTRCYMLIITGPLKVDLIFDGSENDPQPAWVIDSTTLDGVNAHFWDWTLWLASKVDAQRIDTVESELRSMHSHLLGPLQLHPPTSLADAVNAYVEALPTWERRLGVAIDRCLQEAVLPVVQSLPDGGL